MFYGTNWAYLAVDNDILHYYQWLLKRRFHGRLLLHFPKAGAHISVVRGAEIDPITPEYRESAWGRHHDEELEFWYDPTVIGFNKEFFWINTICHPLSGIRTELGLNPRPRYDYHLTIGKIYPEERENFATYRAAEGLFRIDSNSEE